MVSSRYSKTIVQISQLENPKKKKKKTHTFSHFEEGTKKKSNGLKV
jgi:hypothetical protein